MKRRFTACRSCSVRIFSEKGSLPIRAAIRLGTPLALAPAVANGLIELTGIIIDSKSGVTGAGRSLSQGTHYPDLNEGLHAYKVASHRHTPEIEQGRCPRLSGQKVHVTFVPHLLPVNRGILSTCYGRLKPNVTKAQVAEGL